MSRRANGKLAPEFFEEMVETVGVGVAIYGSDGVYRYINDAYAGLFDVDRESLVGRAVWEVVPEFERDRFGDYWASFEVGETRFEETEHEFEGTQVPVSTVTTRRDIDGEAYHFGTIQDITERHERERELERQNERLESFVGIVSHDLRNPLNVAQGYLDLLEPAGDGDEVELMGSALDRMETLIEDLLTIAREGNDVGDVERVTVAEVADAAWENVETDAARLRIEEGTAVRADDGRLQQLFENLFRNAVEHGSTGSRATADTRGVTVRVGPLADEAGLFVADDGPGIPPDERDRVFDPTYSTGEEGVGFGLAIVKEIAGAHGWEVRTVESADGGARFEFVDAGTGN